MLELVALMEIGIVGLVGAEHFPNDFEPALAQTSERTGMAFAFGAFLLVIHGRPGARLPATVGPEMNDGAEVFVAMPAQVDFVDLAGLETDRRRARNALEGLGIREAFRVHGQFGQQARREQRPGAGQGVEQRMVGVLAEQVLDLFVILIDLGLQGAEDFGQTDGQLTLGRGDRRAPAELVGACEDFQTARDGFRSPQQVRMQEFFPAMLAGLRQELGRRELENEIPGGRQHPFIKGFQGRRIIFLEGRFELIDQRGALFNEMDFIATPEPQLFGERVVRRDDFPVLTLGAQGGRQRPRVQLVIFDAAGGFAFAVARRADGVDGINGATADDELVHNQSVLRFDGEGQRGKRFYLFAKLLPARRGMGEAEVGDDVPFAIEDDDVVMIVGPVQAAEVSHGRVLFIHGLILSLAHRGPVTSQADTRSLTGYCSLRLLDRRRRRTGKLPGVFARRARGDREPPGRCGQTDYTEPQFFWRGTVIHRWLRGASWALLATG